MRILVTSQNYWPDNFLITEIAEELVKKGHQVTVLTGLPDYSTNKIPKKYKFGRNRHEKHNGVEIIRVPIIARHHGFIFRVLNYLSFFISSSIYARVHRFKNIDVIYSWQTAPVLMINPAIILKKKLKKPLMIYVLDIWPDQMKVWNIYENNLLYKLIHRYCKKAYGSGDIVGVTSLPFIEYLKNICEVDEKKMIYLPQHSAKLEIKDTNHIENSLVNFIFAGNIGQQQNVECLIKAISLMKTKKNFVVNIYGDGTSLEKCKKYTKDLKMENRIIFHGRVNKEKLNNIYPKMDAFLLTLRPEKEIGFVANTIPAKLQGYMSGGKPILASIDGGAKQIINESKCGAVVPAGDAIGYATILDDFVENRDKYKLCGKNAIDYFNKNFEKKIVMDKLENILIELAKKEGIK